MIEKTKIKRNTRIQYAQFKNLNNSQILLWYRNYRAKCLLRIFEVQIGGEIK